MASKKPEYFLNFLILSKKDDVEYLIFKESDLTKNKYLCNFIYKSKVSDDKLSNIRKILRDETYELIDIDGNNFNKRIKIGNTETPLTTNYKISLTNYKLFIIRIDDIDIGKYETNKENLCIIKKCPTTNRPITERLILIPFNNFVNGNFYFDCTTTSVLLTTKDNKDQLKKISSNNTDILTKNINQNILNVQNINIIRLCQEVFKNNSLNIPVELKTEKREVQNGSTSKNGKSTKTVQQMVTIETYKSISST